MTTRNAYFRERKLAPLDFDEVMNGTFSARVPEVAWVAELGDGIYSDRGADGSILLHDLGKKETRTLVEGGEVIDVRVCRSRV